MATLDLNKMKAYYKEGYSPFGKPYDGYYVGSHHGIQSLQGYFTTMMCRDEAGFKHPEKFQFWMMNKDAQTYTFLNTNTADFEKFVVSSALEQGLLNPEKYKFNSEKNPSPYRDLINNVYNGEVDKLHFSDNVSAFGVTGRTCQEAFCYHLARKREGVIDNSSNIASDIYIERMLNEPEFIASDFLKTGEPKNIPWSTRRDNYIQECTRTYISRKIDEMCELPTSKVDKSLFIPLEIADTVIDDCYTDAEKYTDNYKTVVNQIMSNLQNGVYVEMRTPKDQLMARRTPMINEAEVTANINSGKSTDKDKFTFGVPDLKDETENDINLDALVKEIQSQGLSQEDVDRAILATIISLQKGYGRDVVPSEVIDREEAELAKRGIVPPTQDEIDKAIEACDDLEP